MDNSQYIKLFEKIYTDDFHKIKYFVFSYLKDDSIAEEVAQDSFMGKQKECGYGEKYSSVSIYLC